MNSETAQKVNSTATRDSGSGGEKGVVGGDNVVCNLKPGGKWESNKVPLFLVKTFGMVDDPETDSIISWNSTGTGFIVWDHNKFVAEVLPMLFKTSNFSSFVCQLNTYGFKKISRERCEYANEWFQAGKREWMKNIKRRNQQSQVTKKQVYIMEKKLDALMAEQNDMKLKFQEIIQSLDNMKDRIERLETNIEFQEFDMKLNFAVFVQMFLPYLKKEKDKATGGNSKKLIYSKKPRLGDPSRKIHLSD